MKKSTIFLAAVLTLALAGCAKQGTARFTGNYSFKTSGVLYAVRDSSSIYDTVIVSSFTDSLVRDTVITAFPDSSSRSIKTESGQMDITDTGGGRVLITMNCTGGDLVVYYAQEKDGKLVLEPARRKVAADVSSATVSSDTQEIKYNDASFDSDVTVSGTGTRYDNIILFDLTYEGTYKYNDILYHIYDSDIYCRAKENE